MEQSTFVENAHGRHVDDYYKTPAAVTLALCDEFKLRGIEPKTILDVGCGDGAIGMVCRQTWPNSIVVGIDADAGRSGRARALGRDGISRGTYDIVQFDKWAEDRICLTAELIVSNPPFKFALQFMKLALQRVRLGGHVAFLLISQYDQETVHDDERGKFLDLLRRPDGSEGYGKLRWKGRIDFRGDGKTDRVSHEWFVIGPGFEGSFVRVPRSPMGGSEQLTMEIP